MWETKEMNDWEKLTNEGKSETVKEEKRMWWTHWDNVRNNQNE